MLRTIVPVLLAALVYQGPPRVADVAIVHTTVVDVSTGALRREVDVLVAEGVIVAVRPSSPRVADARDVLDGRGKFVIPGLRDMHVHALSRRDDYFFPLFVANGVTAVREMGTPGTIPEIVKARDAVLTQIAPAFTVGKTLDGARPARAEQALAVATPDEARARVRELKNAGADHVKVYSLLSHDAFFAALDESRKVGIPLVGHVPTAVDAREASDGGMKSMEHSYGILEACSPRGSEIRAELIRAAEEAPTGAAAWGAVVQGSDREYARQAQDATFDAKRCDALFAAFVRNGTWQCPTLVVRRAFAGLQDPGVVDDPRLQYVPASVRQAWAETSDPRHSGLGPDLIAARRIRLEQETKWTRAMRRAGVRILAGTDVGNAYVVPGFSLHDELQLLVAAGLSPVEALQAATRDAAEFLGQLDRAGTIEPGRLADMVVLDANPLESISNTQKIDAVVLRGRLLRRAALDDLLRRPTATGR